MKHVKVKNKYKYNGEVEHFVYYDYGPVEIQYQRDNNGELIFNNVGTLPYWNWRVNNNGEYIYNDHIAIRFDR